MKPVRFIPLVYGLVAGAVLLGGTILFLPVEWKEAQNRFKLWKSGAKPVLWEKHRGFTLDRCDGKSPAECECVWFIHGMGDSVSTWRKFFVEPKSFGDKAVRIYAIDLPGHGGSLKRKDPLFYRASMMAKELSTKIAVEPSCTKNLLVGNSFGGWVATLMALDAPQIFKRLVLIGPSGMTEGPDSYKELFSEPTIESLKEFQKRAYFKPREISDSEWKIAFEKFQKSSVTEIKKAQVPEDRLDQKLANLNTPTTLIYGDSDRIVPREEINRFMKAQPAIQYRELTKCGHLPQKECPEQLFKILGALPE